jgi:spore coat polysaccharide biosynthesis protein SpsF (cytidylyltransferase family)
VNDIRTECFEAIKSLDEAMNAKVAMTAFEKVTSNLARNHEEGKTQWWNPNLCQRDDLRVKLVAASNAQDFEAVLCYAAMIIHIEENPILNNDLAAM